MKELTVKRNDAGQRLDRFVAKAVPLLPEALLQKYIRIKRIKLNGKGAKRDTRLAEGDVLSLYINDEFFEKPREENSYLKVGTPKLNIVYEDENVLLADKKPGVLCHSAGQWDYNTLIANIQAYMSQKGYDELVAKLQHMESVDRPAASAAIAEARDKGDLSENAEYDAAKEWQSKLETQIALLKQTIMDAKILDTRNMDMETVQIMATVGLKNLATGAEMRYTLVSATEADLRAGKISVETPIAQGLLGKRVGDTAKIQAPRGEMSFEVTSISYDL